MSVNTEVSDLMELIWTHSKLKTEDRASLRQAFDVGTVGFKASSCSVVPTNSTVDTYEIRFDNIPSPVNVRSQMSLLCKISQLKDAELLFPESVPPAMFTLILTMWKIKKSIPLVDRHDAKKSDCPEIEKQLDSVSELGKSLKLLMCDVIRYYYEWSEDVSNVRIDRASKNKAEIHFRDSTSCKLSFIRTMFEMYHRHVDDVCFVTNMSDSTCGTAIFKLRHPGLDINVPLPNVEILSSGKRKFEE